MILTHWVTRLESQEGKHHKSVIKTSGPPKFEFENNYFLGSSSMLRSQCSFFKNFIDNLLFFLG